MRWPVPRPIYDIHAVSTFALSEQIDEMTQRYLAQGGFSHRNMAWPHAPR